MKATFLRERLWASLDGTWMTGALGWLVRDVLISDEKILAASLIGGIFGTWLTTDDIWRKIRSVDLGLDDGRRGARVMNVAVGLGMMLTLIVVGSAWVVHFLPNIPVVGGLIEGVPPPALAGVLSLLSVAVGPRLWGDGLGAVKRLLGSLWRNKA